MPHSNSRISGNRELFKAELFLRSLNLCFDANEPARIAHFYPTTKSVNLLRSLLGEGPDRALLVVAPYGSGKTLAATYLLHLIENRPDSSGVLETIERKLVQVSPELGRFARVRREKARDHGLVLALHGYCRSLADGIQEAALEALKRLKLGRHARALQSLPNGDINQAIATLARLKEITISAGLDRIVILWDEFGRHIESLVADGRPAAMADIQLLAEFASRSRDVPLNLGLLLHQGLLHYASNLPQSVRNEWAKVEGRFRPIQYVDDSKEIYRLIGEVVASKSAAPRPSEKQFAWAANQSKRLGMFPDFSGAELKRLLQDSYPLEPTTLFLLPRIAARVAQNERTLFTFLYSIDPSSPVSLPILYDYFSPAMRSDTTVGGTHRQWLETQSAISKVVDNTVAVEVLKAACLLSLGTIGERSRAGRELLRFTLQGFGQSPEPDKVIEDLIERKLLLYRRHNDEVAVWHGTDVDLRSRLEEEKRRNVDNFNLLEFLTREVRPPAWKPAEYNDDFYIRRYFPGEYQTAAELQSWINMELSLRKIVGDSDGKILYLLAENASQLKQAETIAKGIESQERLILAIPRRPLPVFDAAMEVWCLMQLQMDSELISSDPLVLSEIHQMSDDSRAHLQRLVDQLVRPGPTGPRWFWRGEQLQVESPRDLRKELSRIARSVYSKTPKINNEMIVRRRPSPIVVNARKKLLLGILERSGTQNLGLKGYFPDSSMFRTVLLHTGLYRQESGGRWTYAPPETIEDLGLREVWQKIEEFLTVPDKSPKHPRALFEELQAPPYGVRTGLMPILISAGLKAFPSALSLTRQGKYVTDILPSDIEHLCKEPDQHRLTVLHLDPSTLAYLKGFRKLFSSGEVSRAMPQSDLIRTCSDAVESWKSQLPPAAATAGGMSEPTRLFRHAISAESDPVEMLLKTVPAACGYSVSQCGSLLNAISKCRDELVGVVGIFRRQAADAIRRTVALGRADLDNSVREIARRWSKCFSDGFVDRLNDGVAKGLLTRMQMDYDSDDRLLDSISSILIGRPLSRWDDSSIVLFDRELHNVVRRIEEAALTLDRSLLSEGTAVHGLAKLIKGRVTELYDRLASLVGEEKACAVVESVLADHNERSRSGDNTRSFEHSA